MAEIRINTGENPDVMTAKICLEIAARFAERYNMRILGERGKSGKVEYWFEEDHR